VIEYDEFIPVALAMLEESKKKQSGGSGSQMPRLSEVPAEMLERYLAKLFAVADANGDGVLQPHEFKRLLEMSGFNFSPETVAKLMNAADVNHDGVIEYDEFIPVALAMLEESKKKQSGGSGSQMPRLSEVPESMLQKYFRDLFAVADTNGDGVLQPSEFKRLLEMSGFNFSPQTVAKLMNAADVNHDGVIDYKEFLAVAMEMRRSYLASKSGAQPPAPRPALNAQSYSTEMIVQYLQRLFKIADRNGDGVLSPGEFERLLRLSGFNFDAATLRNLTAAADVNHDGVIEYDEFIPVALEILRMKTGTEVKVKPTAATSDLSGRYDTYSFTAPVSQQHHAAENHRKLVNTLTPKSATYPNPPVNPYVAASAYGASYSLYNRAPATYTSYPSTASMYASRASASASRSYDPGTVPATQELNGSFRTYM